MNGRGFPGFTAELSLLRTAPPKYIGEGRPIDPLPGRELITPQLIHGCRCYGTLHCYPPPVGYCSYGPPYRCYCW
jgi:hypothetical protein